MPKVCIQAGHKAIKNNCDVSLRGSTGAGGEVEVNTAVVDATALLLRAKGVEVKVVDANFNCDPISLDTDWDLFLAVHCDMDYANDNGSGFCDFPEPDTDDATEASQHMAKVIQDTFFPAVGINVKSRSNKNTRYYYMWQCISAKTPCVLIEMGQVKDPHDSVILKDTAKVSEALAGAILTALGLPINDCEKELEEMRESRNKWRTKYEELDKESTKDLQAKIKHIEELQKTIAELNAQLTVNTGGNQSNLDEIAKLREEVAVGKDDILVLKDLLEESKKENERLESLLSRCKEENKEVSGFIAWLKKLFGGGA